MKDEFYSFQMLIRMCQDSIGFKNLILELLSNEENQ
jgi:hypothetical protein